MDADEFLNASSLAYWIAKRGFIVFRKDFVNTASKKNSVRFFSSLARTEKDHEKKQQLEHLGFISRE